MITERQVIVCGFHQLTDFRIISLAMPSLAQAACYPEIYQGQVVALDANTCPVP
ncbi:hypothetical protein NSU_3317 [Novosphingobium pentaromativorans US6-1]|uniref:Uncharacterized protein n=1 Tax=Novosphingobium pentaromativorans US6-1 TaxID=1088721 RepID=G6EG46_9SPHN|nr:hypothetical protein NSU_3317 [Novosphingobium pentaromativorans US6-1]